MKNTTEILDLIVNDAISANDSTVEQFILKKASEIMERRETTLASELLANGFIKGSNVGMINNYIYSDLDLEIVAIEEIPQSRILFIFKVVNCTDEDTHMNGLLIKYEQQKGTSMLTSRFIVGDIVSPYSVHFCKPDYERVWVGGNEYTKIKYLLVTRFNYLKTGKKKV